MLLNMLAAYISTKPSIFLQNYTNKSNSHCQINILEWNRLNQDSVQSGDTHYIMHNLRIFSFWRYQMETFSALLAL